MRRRFAFECKDANTTPTASRVAIERVRDSRMKAFRLYIVKGVGGGERDAREFAAEVGGVALAVLGVVQDGVGVVEDAGLQSEAYSVGGSAPADLSAPQWPLSLWISTRSPYRTEVCKYSLGGYKAVTVLR
jgi:hypothetical protein